MAITGEKVLDDIEYLELRVDSRKTGLGNLGNYLPNIKQLKLNNSHVPIVRDLGSRYNNLVILWMARCSLVDMDGIGSFINLKELYLAYNEIKDISDLARLEYLEVLDLESNDITDLDQLENLTLCQNLQELTLEGNPLNFEGVDNVVSYDDESSQTAAREFILKILPSLQLLDERKVDDNSDTPTPILAAQLERPATSYGRRPKSPMTDIFQSQIPKRPQSAFGQRKCEADPSSNLTIGMEKPLAGNPIMMLRRSKSSRSYQGSKPDTKKVDILVLDKPNGPELKASEEFSKEAMIKMQLSTSLQPVQPPASQRVSYRRKKIIPTHLQTIPIPAEVGYLNPIAPKSESPIIVLAAKRAIKQRDEKQEVYNAPDMQAEV
ncbi:hypothetical protein BC833DRAFT_610085 [Globomyces pollinis-pini]|nr:hypothetical protein BC833DRAFT_610085 [Globomyces pollinis-pini]